MPNHTKTVVIAGGPADLAATLTSCVEMVPRCAGVHRETLKEAQQSLLEDRGVGLLLVYLDQPANQGPVVDLLTVAQTRVPAIPVIVIAESESNLDRGGLLQAGAADCLSRPLNLSRLSFLIDFLTLRGRSLGPVMGGAPDWEEHRELSKPQLIFVSERSKELLRTAERLAQVDSNVLLAGETGTGKTCLARMLHDLSPRRKKPYVVVNCGAIPESLLESELFGHGQGAFTGADRDHRGKFAQAEDGTIFLDEIDSLPLNSQSSLLRVVEDRAYEAVGSGKSQQVQSRFIFATNRDLNQEVKAGRFRQDLYFRLNVVSLVVPPMRERTSAIPQLVSTFLSNLRARRMTRVERFSPEAMAQLADYHWPGNVRELRNIVERVAVLADKAVISVEDLPDEIRIRPSAGEALASTETGSMAPSSTSLRVARKAAERETIVSTLEKCRDNRTKAAELLGISRTAFYKKLNQLGIA